MQREHTEGHSETLHAMLSGRRERASSYSIRSKRHRNLPERTRICSIVCCISCNIRYIGRKNDYTFTHSLCWNKTVFTDFDHNLNVQLSLTWLPTLFCPKAINYTKLAMHKVRKYMLLYTVLTLAMYCSFSSMFLAARSLWMKPFLER